MKTLKGKRVLVTGGSGFIGSHLCRRLVTEGAKLAVVTRYDSIIDNVRLADLWGKIVVVESDLRNPDSLKKVAAFRPHIVFHFAAYNHVGDSFGNVSEAIDVNGKGTVNLMDAYEAYERFVYISSSEIYGYQEEVPFVEEARPFPISPYSVGKYAGELYARMKWHVYKRPVVVLRPFNAFGPYQSPRAIIAEIVLKCIRGEEIRTTKGMQTREFNFVENLVDGFILAATREEAVGEIINLGSGREVRIRDLVRMIHRLSGSSSRLRIGALPYRPTEIWRMFASNEKAHRLLGWKPEVSIEEGLRRTIEWYRSFAALYEAPASPLKKICE